MSAHPSPEITNQFGALVNQGIELLNRLQGLLDKELEAMQERALESLQQNNRDKQECLLAIDRNIRERNGLLSQLQVGHDRVSVLDFIARIPAPDNTQLKHDWQQLEISLEAVKTLNQRNEQVLLRSKQSTDQLLALLQGHAQGNSIYDQKGDKGRYEGQRSLGKA